MCPSPPPGCPPTPPHDGDPCPCGPFAPCEYDACSTLGAQITATCSAGVWGRASTPCAPIPCGSSTCDPPQVCLRTSTGLGFTYKCVDDPCVGHALTCSCAGPLCASLYKCSTNGATEIDCDCPTCS